MCDRKKHNLKSFTKNCSMEVTPRKSLLARLDATIKDTLGNDDIEAMPLDDLLPFIQDVASSQEEQMLLINLLAQNKATALVQITPIEILKLYYDVAQYYYSQTKEAPSYLNSKNPNGMNESESSKLY
jgi:hypothetical protein